VAHEKRDKSVFVDRENSYDLNRAKDNLENV